MAFFSQKYGKAEKLTRNEMLVCWLLPIALAFVFFSGGEFSFAEVIFGAIVFGIPGGGLLAFIWRRRKHNKAERAFLNDLKARGVKPKITNVRLNYNGAIAVYVEDYGEFWTMFDDLLFEEKHDLWFQGHDANTDKQSYKCTNVSWTDDTVTLTYVSTEGQSPYREKTFEKTYSVFKEALSWRRVK